MERSASRKGPQRQETLGPSAPIWDWEVERATLRTECREYREKAEQLEEDLKKERQIYEKNTTSLLHEVKLKESVMEKKLKDLEEQFTAQLLELQKRLDEERLSRQEILQNIHAQHETALQSEEKKYQRRLASLRERLDAKDREYAEILRSQEANMSVPQTIEASDEQIGADEDIKRNESLLNEQDKSALKEGNLQDMVNSLQINCKELEQNLDTSTLFTELEDHRKKQKEYSNRINELEKELKVAQDDSQKYKKRLDQALKTHNEEISELTEKFMSETHRTEMTFQARMQNFQTEQADIIRDLKDQYDTQQEVMQIEHAAILDEVRRNLDFEKAEAIRELNKEWREHMDDIKATMSKDSAETQTYWEAKIEETKAKSEQHIKRLQGEIEVVKDRLGQEIHRRKQYQKDLTNATQKMDTVAKIEASMKENCKILQKENRRLEEQFFLMGLERRETYNLALNLLSICSSTTHPNDMPSERNLNDMLKEAARQLSIQRFSDNLQLPLELSMAPGY